MRWWWRAALLVVAGPALAQVDARQATPDEVAKAERGQSAEASIEVKNPMLLEVRLERKDGSNALAVVEREDGTWLLTYSTSETKKFTVDRAHVARVRVELDKPGRRPPKKVPVTIAALMKTGYFRQDLDVTLELLDADGKVVTKRHWNDETVGDTAGFAYGGVPKELALEMKLDPPLYAQLSAPGRAATLRILVEVQGEEGDEDED